MTLWIKNGAYALLIKLDLMFSMSLWKEFQLIQILNDLSIVWKLCKTLKRREEVKRSLV